MAPLGNLVRLLPLHINELPAHPALESLVNSTNSSSINAEERPNVITFVKEILVQATTFADDTLPITFKEGSLRPSPPSKAQVRLLNKDIGAAEVESIPWTSSSVKRAWSAKSKKPPEAWFARRSHHVNQKSDGTADFDEFDFGLRHEHSKHEQAYTPDVFDSNKVFDWEDQIKETPDDSLGLNGYSNVNMSIFEMCHELPAMLSNRVFSVLVVTAKTTNESFIVVQIPVDISNLSAALYSNGRNLKEGDSSLKRKKTVLGVYTSIERCRLLDDGNVEWIMATASDAKGSLPMPMQKLGVPSAVVKDVGLFMKWIQERRSSTGLTT